MITKVYSKRDRQLLSGLLKGTLPAEAGGVRIQFYADKIAQLLAQTGETVTTSAVHQRVFWLANSQPTWRAAHELLLSERAEWTERVMSAETEPA